MPTTKGPKTSKASKDRKQSKGGEQSTDGADVEKNAVPAGEDRDHCVDCGRKVSPTQQGLQCDSCGFWHHSHCEEVSEEVYEFLSTHNNVPSILWSCKKCLATNKKMMSVLTVMQDHQQQLEEKLNDLSSKMNKKMEDLTNALKKRLDTEEPQDTAKVEETQKRVEEKVDKLMERMEKQKDDDGPKQFKGCIQECVKVTLKEDRDEEEEQQKRRTSIIIHGLAESQEEEAVKRLEEDTSHVYAIMHDLKLDDVKAMQIIRLGKKPANATDKPRSIKAVLQSEDQKDKTLKAAKNLKDMKKEGWDRVFIQQDLTPKQQEKKKELLGQMKERKEEGEQNLILWNWKIIKRRPRLN